MDNKGQHLTLEQMFFFTIGILITIGVFFSYSTIQDKIENLSSEDQVDEIAQTIMSGIAKVAKELERNDYYEIVVEIPDKIGDNNYIVNIANNQLEVRDFNSVVSRTISLEGLSETYEISGSIISSLRNVRIVGDANDKTIIISRSLR